MATTVVKTIGSAGGRDYSTLQSWEDASPADLVTADEIWQGECYNDSEFLDSGSAGTAQITIAGSTTDSTRYKHLTAATGQSFQDNAGVRSNSLTYDQSKGVGIRNDGNYAKCVRWDEDYIHISRLQFKADHTNGQQCIGHSSSNHGQIKDVLCYSRGNNSNQANVSFGGGTILIINVISIVEHATSAAFFCFHATSGLLYIGCTAVRLTDNSAAGTAYRANYVDGNAVLQSSTSFGFTTTVTASQFHATNSKNNATDQSSIPGTSAQTSVSYTSTTPFTLATIANADLRSIASTALAANGFLDATNAPNDISATVRADPPTIGHWELTAAAAAGPQPRLLMRPVFHR